MFIFLVWKTKPAIGNDLPWVGGSKSNEVISFKDDEVFRILWNAYLPINVSLIIVPSG